MTELNLNSNRREIPSPLKLKPRSQVIADDALPTPLIHLHQQTIDPTAASPLRKPHGPSGPLQMGGQLNYYSIKVNNLKRSL